jgi:iron complex transport system permease protein
VTAVGGAAVRVGRLSLRWRPRHALVVGVAAAALLLVAVVSLGLGERTLGPGQVLQVLAGGGSALERLLVTELRMPRTVVGIGVGLALGASGAVTQTVARNPLASPDIVGVTAGAGTGAVAVLVLDDRVGGSVPGPSLPVAAMAGGLAAATAVYLLAFRRGVDGYRLVLVGIGVGAVLTSLTSWLLVAADLDDATRATVWLTGSLNAAAWPDVAPVLGGVAVLLPVLGVLAAGLGVLQLGDDVARGLGVRVETARLAVLVLAVLLASLATAVAGPVAFVALACPQLARMLCRTARPPLLASAVLGGVLVTAADVLARLVVAPAQLPVGVVTALLGAPYLLFLLTRMRRRTT